MLEDTKTEQELDQATTATKQLIHQDPNAAQQLATSPQMQDTVVEVEKDLLHEIITRLDENKISTEEAQQLAKEFLSLLPIQDQKDLLDKLRKLSQTNRATQGIYLKYAGPYEEADRHTRLKMMSEHIQQGNIEHAIAVAKGGKNNA